MQLRHDAQRFYLTRESDGVRLNSIRSIFSVISERGISMVEMAIAIPVLMLLIFGFIEYSRATAVKGLMESGIARAIVLAQTRPNIDLDPRTCPGVARVFVPPCGPFAISGPVAVPPIPSPPAACITPSQVEINKFCESMQAVIDEARRIPTQTLLTDNTPYTTTPITSSAQIDNIEFARPGEMFGLGALHPIVACRATPPNQNGITDLLATCPIFMRATVAFTPLVFFPPITITAVSHGFRERSLAGAYPPAVTTTTGTVTTTTTTTVTSTTATTTTDTTTTATTTTLTTTTATSTTATSTTATSTTQTTTTTKTTTTGTVTSTTGTVTTTTGTVTTTTGTTTTLTTTTRTTTTGTTTTRTTTTRTTTTGTATSTTTTGTQTTTTGTVTTTTGTTTTRTTTTGTSTTGTTTTQTTTTQTTTTRTTSTATSTTSTATSTTTTVCPPPPTCTENPGTYCYQPGFPIQECVCCYASCFIDPSGPYDYMGCHYSASGS